LINFHILHIVDKCTGSVQFRMNDYFALLVRLLIKRVRHLNLILLTWSCTCGVGYPSTFGRENACVIYYFLL